MKLTDHGTTWFNARSYYLGQCFVLVSEDAWLLHLSISHKSRYPSWAEIKEARKRLLPADRSFAMAFPKEGHWVNLSKTCFHLWEMKPGETEKLLDIWEGEPEVSIQEGHHEG